MGIAQGAVLAAHSALGNQEGAGSQAEYQAASALAQAVAAAAATAQAAAAGKQVRHFYQ